MTPEEVRTLDEVREELMSIENDESYGLIKLIWRLEEIINKYSTKTLSQTEETDDRR